MPGIGPGLAHILLSLPCEKVTERETVLLAAAPAAPVFHLSGTGIQSLAEAAQGPETGKEGRVFRGQGGHPFREHEKYLAPFTALLVFYSFFTLLVAVVQPKADKGSLVDDFVRGFQDVTVTVDSLGFENKTNQFMKSLVVTVQNTLLVTRLDKFPEAVDTPWKESLAAVEGDLRSKGIPLFLGGFLIMWMAMAIVLRKRGVSFSGAAAASAYVLCQFCVFMFLALLVSWGQSTELGVLLMGVLLFIDFRQMLGLKNKPALRLTVRTGLLYLAFLILFYALVGTGLILFALTKV